MYKSNLLVSSTIIPITVLLTSFSWNWMGSAVGGSDEAGPVASVGERGELVLPVISCHESGT